MKSAGWLFHMLYFAGIFSHVSYECLHFVLFLIISYSCFICNCKAGCFWSFYLWWRMVHLSLLMYSVHIWIRPFSWSCILFAISILFISLIFYSMCRLNSQLITLSCTCWWCFFRRFISLKVSCFALSTWSGIFHLMSLWWVNRM